MSSICSFRFRSLADDDMWRVGKLEVVLVENAVNLPVEQACLSYVFLDTSFTAIQSEVDEEHSDASYEQLLKNLHKAVEGRLVQRVAMATKCPSWNQLPETKQNQIMQLGFFNPVDKAAAPKKPLSSARTIGAGTKRTKSIDTSQPTTSRTVSGRLIADSNSPRNRSPRRSVPIEVARPPLQRGVLATSNPPASHLPVRASWQNATRLNRSESARVSTTRSTSSISSPGNRRTTGNVSSTRTSYNANARTPGTANL